MSRVTTEWDHECLWVRDGEGRATRKYDGTCTMIMSDGSYWRRRTVKPGLEVPEMYLHADLDKCTGKKFGCVPVDPDIDKYHMDALAFSSSFRPDEKLEPGTYELIGPRIQGNAEHVHRHILVPHGQDLLEDCPRDYDGLMKYLAEKDIEGIVWHGPGGRMAKIKALDFGTKRS